MLTDILRKLKLRLNMKNYNQYKKFPIFMG